MDVEITECLFLKKYSFMYINFFPIDMIIFKVILKHISKNFKLVFAKIFLDKPPQ